MNPPSTSDVLPSLSQSPPHLILWLIFRDLGETATHRSSSFRAQFAEYPELFASRRFWGYCAASAFAAGAFFAYLGGAPYVGTEVYGLTPAMLGLLFGAPAAGPTRGRASGA